MQKDVYKAERMYESAGVQLQCVGTSLGTTAAHHMTVSPDRGRLQFRCGVVVSP